MTDKDVETPTPVSKDHQPNSPANPVSVQHVESGAAAVLAKEATLASRASEAMLASRASEATLAAVKTGTDKIPASPAATADVQAVRDRLPAALHADGGLKAHIVNQNPAVVQGRLDDTATTPAAEDAAADIRITPQRAAHVNLRDQSGNELLAPKTFTANLTAAEQTVEVDAEGRASAHHITRRVGAGSATVAFEETPDGVNWFNWPYRNSDDLNGSWASGNLSIGTGFTSLISPVSGKRFRIRVVSVAGGVTVEIRGILVPMRVNAASDYAKQTTLASRASEATLATISLNTNTRPSQKAGRVHVRAHIRNKTVTTVIRAVTAGKTFYLTSLILSVFNEEVGIVGEFAINDGADEKIPFVLPPAVVGATNPSIGTSPLILEPIQFVTDVKFNVIAGTPRASITIIGYEE